MLLSTWQWVSTLLGPTSLFLACTNQPGLHQKRMVMGMQESMNAECNWPLGGIGAGEGCKGGMGALHLVLGSWPAGHGHAGRAPHRWEWGFLPWWNWVMEWRAPPWDQMASFPEPMFARTPGPWVVGDFAWGQGPSAAHDERIIWDCVVIGETGLSHGKPSLASEGGF